MVMRHGQRGYYALADLPQAPPIEESALSTWWELDQIWRVYPGQFTVVTGIPGHGKSTFILNVVSQLAKLHGTRSFLYVPEDEIKLRRRLRALSADDAAFKDFANHNCYVQSALTDYFDNIAHTVHWVLEQAEAQIEQDQLDLIVIDPWNELDVAKPPEMHLTEYIGQSLMFLKNFMRIHHVAIILIAHPTKAAAQEARPPTLAEIESSMHWYNKCDNGLVVWREKETATKVISAKCRFQPEAGKRGVCHFYVDPATGLFTPMVGAVS